MPIVERSKQNTPSFLAEVMTGLANWKKPRERMLFILCGAGGLRIGEALGAEIDKHLSSDFLTIGRRHAIARLKRGSKLPVRRDADLHPAIASFLKEYI